MTWSPERRAKMAAHMKALMADPARQEMFRAARLKGSHRAAELRRLRFPTPANPKDLRKYQFIVRELGVAAAQQAFKLKPVQEDAR